MTNSNTSKKIELDFATVFLREDGIVSTEIFSDDSLSLEQTKELLKAYLKVSNGGNVPHLIIPSKFVIPENEVLNYLRYEANKFGKADAYVIKSLPQKILGNFFIKVLKPELPSRLFTNEEEALKWLKAYL